jgi:allantoate deiminase
MSIPPFAPRIQQRLDQLAELSEEPGALTRVFMSPEQARADALVIDWMREAGMQARTDAVGNVIGRYEGDPPGGPALVLGSHLDSVRDAGRYDGPLGVVTAIACVERLYRLNRRMPFAIEVVGFSDEEGTRFGATMLGSKAMAGIFDPALLSLRDARGIRMDEAIQNFGLDPARIGEAARRPEDILAYVELHIEQGPVLEARDLPVGCVTAISGASRFQVTLDGSAGHAGTVPMDRRRDALTAAAECVLGVERLCRTSPAGVVGTVGKLDVSPGAVNVIPGRVRFTIDLRSPDDSVRKRIAEQMLDAIDGIAAARGLKVAIETLHELAATACAPRLVAAIEAAIAAEGFAPPRLPSGAGHDGMAMAKIADIGMIFVRCRGGISHRPDEFASLDDIEAGARVLLRFIENFGDERMRP